MQLHGWGRYPRLAAELLEPPDCAALQELLRSRVANGNLIPRGAGRSYGDSALAPQVLSSRRLDNFIAFDAAAGTLHCGAGVTLDGILKLTVPNGWFLPVLPGTALVSVGGAIAADVHGKNQHRDGSFCDHLMSISLALASGEIVTCTKTDNAELFRATCGGMGLTGMIVDAVLTLAPLSSDRIRRRSLVARDLGHCLELLERHEAASHVVAWVDCLARGRRLGRAVVHLGEHVEGGEVRPRHRSRQALSVPFTTPGFLLNRWTVSAFNGACYRLNQLRGRSGVHYDSYFFPLDRIRNWNRLYGSKGIVQYQFAVPPDGVAAIAEVLQRVSAQGKGSFLAVLKKFGPANDNLLSFPMAGFTLSLDFKREASLFPLLDELDRIVMTHGGRHYLAKDSRMSAEVFRAGYPNLERFVAIKQKVDPDGLFASLQSRRIGLTTPVRTTAS